MDARVCCVLSERAMEQACDQAYVTCAQLIAGLDNDRLEALERFNLIAWAITILSASVNKCAGTIQAIEGRTVVVQ